MSAADVHSILYRGTDPLQKKFEPAKDKKTTVPRYWPGKDDADGDVSLQAPEKAEDELAAISSDEEGGVVEKQQRMQAVLQENRRLHRLARAASTLKPDIEERRQIHAAIILEAEKERRRREAFEAAKRSKEEQEASSKKQTARVSTEEAREQRRLLALQKRKEEEQLLEQQQQLLEDEDEELSSSEYSDGSEDYEDPAPRVIHKPVFVPKDKRESAKERARQEAEAEKQRKEEEQRALERKRSSKQMLYVALQKEEEELRTAAAIEAKEEEEEDMPDDTDGIDPELEYEEWKARELHRIKRDQEERQARDKFLEALERRRQMSEEERKADDKQLDMMHPRREIKFKYNFMQKYYHRGAFFQDMATSGEEPLYLRDFNAPVGEDKWDKKILPAAMRLRRGEFGRQGQTKHTHLVDVDTTDFTSAWSFNTRLKEKTESRMGGEKQYW